MSLPPSGVFVSLIFILLSMFLCRSVFYLLCLLLRCPVRAPCSGFSFIIVRCLSSFSLVVFRFTRVFFFSLGVCMFLCLPTLPPPCVSPLCGLFIRSPRISCSFLFLPLAPVCCLIHFASLSSLRWLGPARVPGFRFHLLVLFCFCFL